MGALTESRSAIKNGTGAWRLSGNSINVTLTLTTLDVELKRDTTF